METTKVLKLLSLGLLALAMAACSNHSGNIENYETGVPITIDTGVTMGTLAGQTSSSICFDTASYLFRRLDTILDSDADAGYLWGISLHGPVVIADAITRYAIANMPDVEGEIFTRQGNFYVGRLPEGTQIGNTASHFGGRRWGMVTWGMIEANADNTELIVDVMLHELFHAKQPYIFEGWFGNTSRNIHMRELEARISIRLEINALLTALHSTGDERLAAIHDALSIRAERRRLNVSAYFEENLYEIAEGTAVYTEAVLGRNNLADRIALIERYMAVTGDYNIIDMFGYYSGALYALLLDEFDIEWRIGISWECDLGALLKDGIGFTEIIPFNEIDLERYGYAEIRLFEDAWVVEVERLSQEAWDALAGPLFLIDATGEFGQGEDNDVRVLFLHGLGVYSYNEFDYDDENIFFLVGGHNDERTIFYGNFTYAAEFGELEVTGGFLMLWRAMWRHGIPAYNIEVDDNRITGTNWVLTLNEGFELREVGGGHFAITAPPSTNNIPSAAAPRHPFAEALSDFFVNIAPVPEHATTMPFSTHAILVDVDGNGTQGMLASKWTYDVQQYLPASSAESILVHRLFLLADNQVRPIALDNMAVTPTGRLITINNVDGQGISMSAYTLLGFTNGQLTPVKSIMRTAYYHGEEDSYAVNYHTSEFWSRDVEQDQPLTHAAFHQLLTIHDLHLGATPFVWEFPDQASRIVHLRIE